MRKELFVSTLALVLGLFAVPAAAQTGACTAEPLTGIVICADGVPEAECAELSGTTFHLNQTCEEVVVNGTPLQGSCVDFDPSAEIPFACINIGAANETLASDACEGEAGGEFFPEQSCVAVPTMPKPGLVLLGLMLAGSGVFAYRRLRAA